MYDARVWVRDTEGDRFVLVDVSPFTIGRWDSNVLTLKSAEVSRQHAEIVQDGDRYLLRDRQSRYGTWVNGESITECELRSGDEIRLGRAGGVELAFFRDGGDTTTGSWPRSIGGVRQLTELLERLRALGSGRVLQDVLALVIDTALEISRADRGFVMLAAATGELTFRLARGPAGQTLTDATFATSRRIPEEVFRTGRTRVERDLFDSDVAYEHSETVELGIRHVICLPLNLVHYVESAESNADDRRIGVLYLDGQARGTLISPETLSMLETLAAEASVAIENARLYREQADKARLEHEMQIAAKIQRAMLPQPVARLPYIRAAATSLPCRAIGGDFFDYFLHIEPGFGFTLGDVAGKGPAAALLGAMMQGMFAFAAQALYADNPASIVASINRALCERPVEARFVTLLFGVIRPDGRLTYCNAGHNPPFVIGRSGVRRLETGGPVLGLIDSAYEQEDVALEGGDTMVVFSDGVVEALNAANEEFGEERLMSVIARTGTDDTERLVAAVVDAVRQFSRETTQSDDITVMVIRYLGQPA
jgi:serine phosphatase RsbU (regulator of sigma subunit)/pSer/pThr/pTyr-binding forkhead associated (FHA) protein